jgi:hypothetical protein
LLTVYLNQRINIYICIFLKIGDLRFGQLPKRGWLRQDRPGLLPPQRLVKIKILILNLNILYVANIS